MNNKCIALINDLKQLPNLLYRYTPNDGGLMLGILFLEAKMEYRWICFRMKPGIVNIR